MARDYKPRRKPKGAFSGWIGVALGLGAGLAVAALVYVKDHKPPTSATQITKSEKKRPRNAEQPPDPDGAGATAGDDSGTSYDFYSSLPKFEVVVPEKEKDVKPDIRPVPETRRGTYVLQAGTYKNVADADRARAQLSLLGIEGNVQKVSVNSDSWLRVRIGPVTNLDELNRLRQILRKADIDVLLIRVG